MDKVCIFCPPGKTSKYIKGTRTREPLTKCVQLQADATIRNIAMQRQDARILVVATRELVAAEAWYHKSCYKLDTNTKDLQNPAHKEDTAESDNDARYKLAEDTPYDQLFQHIRQDLFQNG